MALYQPTYMIPSSYTNTEKTVDVNDRMEISWQVNGNSPLTAFQIEFTSLQGSITTSINTEKIPVVPNFYGTDRFGRPQFFTWNANDTWNNFNSGFTNGNEYKYKITQWYGGIFDVVSYVLPTSWNLQFGLVNIPRNDKGWSGMLSVDINSSVLGKKIYYNLNTKTGYYIEDDNIMLTSINFRPNEEGSGAPYLGEGTLSEDTETFVLQQSASVFYTYSKPKLTLYQTDENFQNDIDLLSSNNISITTNIVLPINSNNYFSFEKRNENNELIVNYASFVTDNEIAESTVIFYNVKDNTGYYYIDETKVFLTNITVSDSEPIGINIGKAYPNLQTSRGYFHANYEQEQGMPIRWIRWQVATAYNGSVGEILADTGDIYTPTLNYEYDGFFNGQQYAVRCLGMSESGQSCDSEWIFFNVNIENQGTYVGELSVKCLNNENATLIEWEKVNVIAGQYTPIGSGSHINVWGNNSVDLYNGKVVWNDVSNQPMNFENWTAVWVGTIGATWSKGDLFSFIINDSEVVINRKSSLVENTITVSYLGKSVAFTFNTFATQFAILISSNQVIVRSYLATGGIVSTKTKAFTISNTPITSISIYSGETSHSTIKNVAVFDNSKTTTNILSLYDTPNFKPSFDDITYSIYMSAKFKRNFEAGTVSSTLNSFRVYRQEIGKNILDPIATVPVTTTAIKDYGIRSRKAYKYYFTAYDDNNAFIKMVEGKNVVATCFKNYSLLVCDYDEANDEYHVRKQYLFALNLSVGSVGNNNNPTLNANFTRYPTRMPSTQNYASGTLQGLIGAIYTVPALVEQIGNYKYAAKPSTLDYFDSVDLEKELYDLSTAPYQLFLRDMKGRLRMIATKSAITMTTNIKQKQQSISISFPWVEIGDASDVTIIQTPNDYGWNNDNQVLDVSLDVDVATGELSAIYPFPYNGTKFYLTGVNKETLTAKTPLGVTPAQFELSDIATEPDDGELNATVKVNTDNTPQIDGADPDDFDGGDFGYGNFDEAESEDK